MDNYVNHGVNDTSGGFAYLRWSVDRCELTTIRSTHIFAPEGANVSLGALKILHALRCMVDQAGFEPTAYKL
jgi:hypothetical protein